MKIENRRSGIICFSIVLEDTKEKKSIILTPGMNEVEDIYYNVLKEQEAFKNFCQTSCIKVWPLELDKFFNKNEDDNKVQREVITPLEVKQDVNINLNKTKKKN